MITDYNDNNNNDNNTTSDGLNNNGTASKTTDINHQHHQDESSIHSPSSDSTAESLEEYKNTHNGTNYDEMRSVCIQRTASFVSHTNSNIDLSEKHNQKKDNCSILKSNILSKVDTLSRVLSTHKMSQLGDPINLAKNDFDLYSIMQQFVSNSQEEGIWMRHASIVSENLTLFGKDSSSSILPTLTTLITMPFNKSAFKHKAPLRKIIKNVNILVESGEMCLVLGRPGAGCSTLLKSLAGQLHDYHHVEGDVLYNNISQKEMMKHYQGDVIYNPEMDVHFPHLTVKQTLDFAIRCKIPAVRVTPMKKDHVSKEDYYVALREIYARVFGLSHVLDTKVGNDFVRGVSGGERKRVSIAEALAARGTVYCWDNATRGLDSSTALEYVKSIRILTNLLKSTNFVTIYQAGEAIYEHFDKVTILYDGRQIYFGRIQDACGYFKKLGYVRPSRQTSAEYLTALTDPNGYHEFVKGFDKNRIPITAQEFERAWTNSAEYKDLLKNIAEYKSKVDAEETKSLYNKSIAAEKSKYSPKRSKYTTSFLRQIQLCTIRAFQRIAGDKAFTITNVVAAIIQSLVQGSLFYMSPSDTSGAFSRGGVLYFAVLYNSLMALANMSFDNRPILMKHKIYTLYHPAAEAFASYFAGFPFRMISLTCFIIILYFLSGLTVGANRFFLIYLFLSLVAESINALFEWVCSVMDTLPQANALAGLLMLSISLYSTYPLQPPSMHPWFKWISYALPIRYAFESMLLAEFHNRKMDCGGTIVPSGGSYADVDSQYKVCAFTGSKKGQSWVLGDDYLKQQYTYSYSHEWRNFGIVIGFLCFYLFMKCLFTEFKTPVKGSGDALVFKNLKAIKHRNISNKNDEENYVDDAVTVSDSKNQIYSSSSTTSDNHDEDDDIFAGLRSEGMFIWRNVCFTIPYKGTERKLLDAVSGYCKPGTLTALMGESGAGKTTLLNTLAQRNVGTITGDMLVNGKPIDDSFERKTGYVQQQDIHIGEMTVRESLQFSARLRRPESVPDSEKLAYAEKIIKVLDMTEYAEAIVGVAGFGLNVEQRKKLSIGVELVAKPSLLLFLDEPTSGLDSQSSWAIVQLLKKLAAAGQSILCTIHQPSATLFEQFDRLLLLKKGGQTVYFGDIGANSETVLEYFESNGARKCEKSENPAEYVLEAIGAGATATADRDWHETWLNSPNCARTKQEIDQLINELFDEQEEESHEKPRKYATSYLYQFRYVYIRSATTLWRNLSYIMSKLMLMTIGGLYIGFTFFHTGSSYVGLQNSMFAAFMSIIISAPLMNQIQARAISSRNLYEARESKSNMFHWSLMIYTQYLSELPYHLVFSTIFFVSFYFPLKDEFKASISGVYYLNYSIVFQLYFVGLGLCVLYMSPNLPSANVIMGLILSLLISFCGVTQPKSLMPGFWTFMWKVSPYTYFVQNFVGLLLHNKKVVCKEKELSFFNPPPGQTCGQYMADFFQAGNTGYIVDSNATTNCGYCRYTVGDQYLHGISSSYGYIWRNFGFFWVYIGFNLIAMAFLYYWLHVRHINVLGYPIGLIKKLVSKFKKNKNDDGD
ncbi:probable Protein SNQ2 [Saccharomycodes ludwigii]|uniref:Probable Protein SNQ2 n=1 Tax=Saccharomycodes ludwigii TaxID=36035 RepID=A0A376BA11_9ASCO|nr:probable Protein SNQ2 [Saccharomycodes ludwigii]